MPESKLVEVVHNVTGEGFSNWGKFMLLRFTQDEWEYKSRVPLPGEGPLPLLRAIGNGRQDLWVLDLQTGEGASFTPGGIAEADLDKHRVWVCVMFEPLLEYLYGHKRPFEDCPALVVLPEAEGGLYGYRRPGPK